MAEVIFVFDGAEMNATIDDTPKTGDWVRVVGADDGWFSVSSPGLVLGGRPRFQLRQQVPLEEDGTPSFRHGRWEFHPGYRSDAGL